MSRRHSLRNRLGIHSASAHSDRWVVSYADFITLLMAFFVVMYSMSQVNESKYRVLSGTLQQSFSIDKPMQPNMQETLLQPNVLNIVWPDTQSSMQEGSEAGASAENSSQQETVPHLGVDELASMLRQEFQPLIDGDVLFMQGNNVQLEVTLAADVLFDSGKAAPSEAAQRLFFDMAKTLKRTRGTISIEGHTDNVPMTGGIYPSNWELSAARAAAIVNALEGYGIDPARLTVVGHGEFQPIGSNVTAKSRMKNRRVVLVIHRDIIARPAVAAEQLHSGSGSNSADN
jgi:chemotaxis protein MotB